jgi:DNA-binding beta-propeller fold protein YncE
MLVRTSIIVAFILSLCAAASGAVVRTPVGVAGAQDVVFDTVRNRIYVPTGTGSVARYDMATRALLPSWQGGVNLRGADMTADGAFLYVADQSAGAAQGVIRKINADTGTRTNLFYDMAGEGAGAYDLVRLSTNKMMFTTNHQFSGGGTVVRFIDLANDAISVRANDGVERETDLFRSGDGTRVFMTGGNTSAGNVRVYDAPGDRYLVNTELGTPLNGISAALSPNGDLLAFQGFNVPLALQRSADLSLVETFPHYRSGLGFSPNGLLVMADWQTELFRVYDPATQNEIGTFPAGFDLDPFLVGNLAFSADGGTMVYQTPDRIDIYEGIPVPEPTLALLPLAVVTLRRRGR